MTFISKPDKNNINEENQLHGNHIYEHICKNLKILKNRMEYYNT